VRVHPATSDNKRGILQMIDKKKEENEKHERKKKIAAF
jgi:hypothetical protein